MIRILMLDLGETLVHDNAVFPHVFEALTALQAFKTANGDPLERCLVSDFQLAQPPVTPAKVKKLFNEYLQLLEQFDLAKFFKPANRRITLSTHAGVEKPDRRIFEMAISRLGLNATLEECLFITEKAEHISACKEKLGMATLHFGEDFNDWSEGPVLIDQLIDSDVTPNFELGVNVQLSTKYEMELISMKKREKGDKIHARVHKWEPVPDPKPGSKEKIKVPIPVDVEIDTDKGKIRSVKADQPDSEAVADAASFVETLEANKQVTEEDGPLPPGVTHRIEKDKKGQKRLVRKRFSAI